MLALAWGWLPALLWIWFGNIFIGAVHDYLAIMSSVRYDGKSCQFVAADVIGARTSRIFYWLVFFMIILVIAAFGAVVGGMYVAQPAVASSYVLKLIAALILGFLMYKVKMDFRLATLIGIVLLIFAIIGGTWLPIKLGWGAWMIIIGVYMGRLDDNHRRGGFVRAGEYSFATSGLPELLAFVFRWLRPCR